MEIRIANKSIVTKSGYVIQKSEPYYTDGLNNFEIPKRRLTLIRKYVKHENKKRA
jgi:hypothetical protein